jgi:hypothetical protein
MSGLLDAAQRYAELGYPVFPCVPGRKTPLTRNGFHDATTNAEQIDAWWQRYPNANVAIPTAGLVVIDVDGPENSWLTDEPERLNELAAGSVAVTPRGGRHYYFRQPDGVPIGCQTGQLAPQVDVRAAGGYVLVPPSIVGGKSYRWAEGLELDQPLDRQRSPPAWLLEQLHSAAPGGDTSRRTPVANVGANEIPNGQRNATLARLAGAMRRVGMTRSEMAAALNRTNLDRCAPPLSPAEVEQIAESVASYEPDQISVAVVENHWNQVFGKQAAGAELKFEAITSRELDETPYELDYLIEGMLVRGQPGVIAGPKKTLKTNISIDLALALSDAGLFLGQFNVPKPVRVGVMSGESGAATIQETARRIAHAKAKSLREFERVFWSFEVPQLGNVLHTDALQRFIEAYQLEVLVLDPTYLMMLGLGDNAGNLFIVGSFLKSLGEIAQTTGCTPLLCHHLKKGIADPYEPAELDNIAWAGFQEFVRQWLLLNRRARYDPDKGGHHELWMSVGGSAGHSGLWGLNIDEGTRQDVGGRVWEVDVVSAKEAYAERDLAVEESKERKKQSSQEKQREAVLAVLRRFPQGETPRAIREDAGIGARTIQSVLDALVESGEIVPCTVTKNTRQEPAYRLAPGGGPCWSEVPDQQTSK